MNPWPFDEPPNLAVVTTTYVMREGLSILYVSHEQDEEDGSCWQFHCGNGDYDPRVLMLVALKSVLSLDPSLAELASLPAGWEATRTAASEPWGLRPSEPGGAASPGPSRP